MRAKLTHKQVKSSFEEEDYTLLTKEYINNATKLEYICPKGHEHSITWNNWNSGYRCPYCAGQGKPSVDYIRKEFKKEEYILLSKEYKNNHSKLTYVCPAGHKHYTSWASWSIGNRCPHCSGNAKKDIRKIRDVFVSENYKLLSEIYTNANTKLDYICPEGHKHSTTWANWQNGKRCPICAGNIKHTYRFIKTHIDVDGYKLISNKYINAKSKLMVKCSKGHIFKTTWHNWQQGKRCPICPSQQSRFEKDIKLFLDRQEVDYISNDRSVLVNPLSNRPLELDIFFVSLNKAIECNGVYWHTKAKAQSRDKIKSKLCYDKGIDLLVVNDEDWYSNKMVVKNEIMKFLNLS